MPIMGDNSSPLGFAKLVSLATNGDAAIIQLETGTKRWYPTAVAVTDSTLDQSASTAAWTLYTGAGGTGTQMAGGIVTAMSTSTDIELAAALEPSVVTVDKLYFRVATADTAAVVSVYVFGNYLP